ncbi:1,4-dihydroxy-2-naphthoate octaprenyltransferase [Prevotella amnii]|uniref:1,4-dihydroxy-2-naphthoate octaprenyltransferase n=2 Tax=Prevotella amnii TaxID=419005 RepID=A0A096B0V9_9BACT|nr:1,4-dihydroxy-2-naphthoate octaprenyltransferase [Prevotella amnii]KGF52710.1 1,4-dihydroxy-2-naphthoate prenyltransferase [Prevotella amnii DNF00058]KXB80091.1 1,4-dihydroxy-2-naphthoate octaprenyltransferase [Prevotella amnii]
MQTQRKDNPNIDNIRGLKAWILAARPKTLSGAAVPVMIGITLAFNIKGWQELQLIPAVLCLLFAFIMQIDANFINDYYDCLKGNDNSDTRLGPRRACSEGWISLSAMKRGIIITTILACLCGLPLAFFGGWEMVIIGIICVIFCFLYTTTLSYLALGDVLVLCFFGIIPVCLTYFLCTNNDTLTEIPYQVLLISIACGLIIDTLLIVNNYRDYENDKSNGKMTLVTHIGQKYSALLYFALGLIGAHITGILILKQHRLIDFLLATLLMLVYLTLHARTYRKMKKTQGKELNKILGKTARNIFIFGLLTTISFILKALI